MCTLGSVAVTEYRPNDRYQALIEYVAARVEPAEIEVMVRICEERLVEIARGAVSGFHNDRALSRFDKKLESKLYEGYPSVVQAVFDTLAEVRNIVPEEITAVSRAFDAGIVALVPG